MLLTDEDLWKVGDENAQLEGRMRECYDGVSTALGMHVRDRGRFEVFGFHIRFEIFRFQCSTSTLVFDFLFLSFLCDSGAGHGFRLYARYGCGQTFWSVGW